jgi:hypothetical protein
MALSVLGALEDAPQRHRALAIHQEMVWFNKIFENSRTPDFIPDRDQYRAGGRGDCRK